MQVFIELFCISIGIHQQRIAIIPLLWLAVIICNTAAMIMVFVGMVS